MTDTTAIERDSAHRPWPLPSWPWVMFQSWQDLLFAHWPLPASTLRAMVPPQLEIEHFDGSAWVGQTPFRLCELRPRYLPALPKLSDFPEMNLRTYVRYRDKPGIFFFTLDADSWLAVLGARALFWLPYRHAQMKVERKKGRIHYHSRRQGAEWKASYQATGGWFHPEPGTLEYFLTERYALYTVLPNGSVVRGEIHHRRWSIATAEAEVVRNTVPAAHGLDLPEHPPLLHLAARQDTLIWPPMLA